MDSHARARGVLERAAGPGRTRIQRAAAPVRDRAGRPDGHVRGRSADRVGERREPAARARHGTREGSGHPVVRRWRTRPADSSVPDRKPAARALRRHVGSRLRGFRHDGHHELVLGSRGTAADRRHAERPGPVLHGRRLTSDRRGVRVAAGRARDRRRSDAGPESRCAAARRRAALVRGASPGGVAGRARACWSSRLRRSSSVPSTT